MMLAGEFRVLASLARVFEHVICVNVLRPAGGDTKMVVAPAGLLVSVGQILMIRGGHARAILGPAQSVI